jgi:hypothetical protein
MKKIFFILFLCSLVSAQNMPYRMMNSFNAGELSPLLNAREDLSKYHGGLSFPYRRGRHRSDRVRYMWQAQRVILK